jgi:TolB-like protein
MLLGRPEPKKSPVVPTPQNRDAGPKASGPSIAVLAFTNLSRDPENEYFSDGISEELLNVLAKIPGLKVAARTSAFFFKGRNVPIPEVARTLGVAHVVEGSVRKMGNRVRITAQLIDAQDGFHLWSENFDRELQDIFAVQDEIAGLIAKNLQLKLGAAPRAAKTVNPEAHRLVLEGRHFWTLRTDESFTRAELAFSRALKIDPDFAQAHSGLADVAAVRSWYASLGGGVPFKGELARAAADARRALALDASLAEVQATLGTIAYQEFRWAESEHHYQEAFQLNPNYALAYHWQAHLLAGQGRLDAGLTALERSIALDPLSFVTLIIYASQLNFARRYEDVLAITDRARALRSAVHAPLEGARAVALLGLGRMEEAAAAARLVQQEKSFALRWWAGEEALYVLRQAGAPGEAADLLRQWRASLAPDDAAHGPLLHALGHFAEALPFLEQMSPTFFARFYFQVIWDDVRDDPRFHRLLAKLGCEAEYRVGRDTLARMLRQREAVK